MGRDVLRRVRWGNVALAAAVVAALATVIAWPRLAPAPPGLPGDSAQPVVGVDDAPGPGSPPKPRGSGEKRGGAKGGVKSGPKTRRRDKRCAAKRGGGTRGPKARGRAKTRGGGKTRRTRR